MKSLQRKPRSRRHRLLAIEKLELRSMLAAAPITDHGLTGTYFDNVDLSGSSVTRIDPFIDFDFGQGSPAAGIDSDTFSARWTGRISAPYTESYTFYTRSDNGVRLWVNNTLVINNWTSHLETENASPSLPLVAGQCTTSSWSTSTTRACGGEITSGQLPLQKSWYRARILSRFHLQRPPGNCFWKRFLTLRVTMSLI